jgi:hypothetical protein
MARKKKPESNKAPDENLPVWVPIDSVHQHPRNARRGNVAAIRESIAENGSYAMLVVQRSTGNILKGNHTWQALKELGHTQARVLYGDWDDETATRIVLADNRTSDLAGYDDAIRAELMRGLAESSRGLVGTGYDVKDLERLEASLRPSKPPEFKDLSPGTTVMHHTCPRCGCEF